MGHRLEKCLGNCYRKLKKMGAIPYNCEIGREVSWKMETMIFFPFFLFFPLDRDLKAKVRVSAGLFYCLCKIYYFKEKINYTNNWLV